LGNFGDFFRAQPSSEFYNIFNAWTTKLSQTSAYMPFFISANSQAGPLIVKHNSAINGSDAENKKVPILFASPEAYRIWESLVTFSL
jgi:hypothetical protein